VVEAEEWLELAAGDDKAASVCRDGEFTLVRES
jgi:hypothetical protein